MAENTHDDMQVELEKLLEIAVKYPEVGPPLAAVAYKAGWRSFGDRLVRIGLTGGPRGFDYYAVAVLSARRDGRTEDARKLVLEAAQDLARAEGVSTHDAAEFLRLVRQGFSSLLHDQRDPRADLAFPSTLAEVWPSLEAKLSGDPLYHVIRAQILWYADPAAAEAAWTAAEAHGDAELVWNARGTWAKDAEKDEAAAERAYRAGLEKARGSALLLHNLAQLLMDRHAGAPAEVEATAPEATAPEATTEGDAPAAPVEAPAAPAAHGPSAKQRNRDLNEADMLLRRALKGDSARGLRRFVHATLDRLHAMHTPPERRPREPRARDQRRGDEGGQRPTGPLPEVGATLKGKVVGLSEFGAFVAIAGGHVGLVHRTELAHERVGDPSSVVKEGDEFDVKVLEVGVREDGKQRLALSRKALLEAPAPRPPRPPREGGGEQRGPRREGGGEQRGPRREGGGGGGEQRGPRREGGGGEQRGPRPPRDGGGEQRGPRRDGGGEGRPPRREGGEGGEGRPQRRDERPAAQQPASAGFGESGKLSLGEMLLAKLREQEAARKG